MSRQTDLLARAMLEMLRHPDARVRRAAWDEWAKLECPLGAPLDLDHMRLTVCRELLWAGLAVRYALRRGRPWEADGRTDHVVGLVQRYVDDPRAGGIVRPVDRELVRHAVMACSREKGRPRSGDETGDRFGAIHAVLAAAGLASGGVDATRKLVERIRFETADLDDLEELYGFCRDS